MTSIGHSSRRAPYSRARGLKASNPCWSSWGALRLQPPRPPLQPPSTRSGFALPPSSDPLRAWRARVMPGVTVTEVTSVRAPLKPSIGLRERCREGVVRMLNVRANSKKYPEAHRRAARRYQERHRRLGLCVKCSRPSVGGTFYCVVHREYKGLRRPWSPIEDSALRAARGDGVPASEIAAQLGRTVISVRARAERLFSLREPRP